MTELKTLEDINDYIFGNDIIPKLKIKKEAIKWIKHLQEEQEKWRKGRDIAFKSKAIAQGMVYDDNWMYELQKISWIKAFFNITEEDLK